MFSLSGCLTLKSTDSANVAQTACTMFGRNSYAASKPLILPLFRERSLVNWILTLSEAPSHTFSEENPLFIDGTTLTLTWNGLPPIHRLILNRPSGPVKEVQPSGTSMIEPEHCSVVLLAVLLANIKIDIFTLQLADVANACSNKNVIGKSWKITWHIKYWEHSSDCVGLRNVVLKLWNPREITPCEITLR